MDQPKATAPQADQQSPIVEQPPSYESTLPSSAPNASSEPSGFVPSTEIYVGQHRRNRSRRRVGKTMQVGNATYTDLRDDCIEAFCEDCQKRVSNKRECVVRIVVYSILAHAECGPNDHRKGAPLLKAD